MSKSPKGDSPGDRPRREDGKRESWENIDFGWEGLEAPLEGSPTLEQKLPGALERTPVDSSPTLEHGSAEPQVRGLRTLEMDQPAPGLRTIVDEHAPRPQTERDLPVATVSEEVKELPAPSPSEELVAVDPCLDTTIPLQHSASDAGAPRATPSLQEASPSDSGDWDQRALPVAPPGHRRVARTIVGVGTPDLQALMRAEKIVRSAAVRGDLRTDEMPIIVQAPIEEAMTTKARRPPAPPVSATNETARRLAALDDAVTTVEAKGDVEAPESSRAQSVRRLVVPEPGSAVFDDDVVAYAGTPPPPVAALPPVASPRVATRLPSPVMSPVRPPPLMQVPAQGPSNLTLAILWIVAIASVGLAIFLYATRG